MKFVLKLIMMAVALLLVTACEDEDPLDQFDIDLTDEQKAEIIVNDISGPTGGVVGQLQVAASTARESFYRFATNDTTISVFWVQHDLDLTFYNNSGSESAVFSPLSTDSLTVQSTLTGDTSIVASGADVDINMNRSATLEVGSILSRTAVINGQGTDQSSQSISSDGLSYDLNMNGLYNVNDVVIPLSEVILLPQSGTVTGITGGELASNGLTANIEIPYTVTFDGSAVVTVTLTNEDKTYRVNVLTAQLVE